MYLIIDIGNSFTKIATFKNNVLLEHKKISNNDFSLIQDYFNVLEKKADLYVACIISSVKADVFNFIEKILFDTPYILLLDNNTPIPINNNYQTKLTLGVDRLAAAVGANNIFPNNNVMVVDVGTAMTIDFVSADNSYQGGIISPGLAMRFKALNKFTNKLPLEKENFSDNNLKGLNTSQAIRYGVQNSMIFEIQQYINNYGKIYGNLKVVLTGGDTFFFENTLKKKIFADKNLVLHGLNRILDYNYAEKD